MKKTQLIEATRNIRRNRVSFFSIVIISMLAVVAFLGLSFSAEGLKKCADATYASGRFADIEINAAAAFSQRDLDAVRASEGVADAEGIVSLPSRVSSGSDTKDIVLRSLSEQISLPHLLDGRLPQTKDECAVEKTLADKMGYQLGDQVHLTGRSAATDAAITEKNYTVTGVFTIAEHLTEMIFFEPMILVTRDAFHPMLASQSLHTRILVRLDAADCADRFSPASRERADRAKQQLEAISDPWIVTPLHNTASFICTDEDAGLLSTVSVTFSMLFVVIAALVIYSTIGRLVGQESRLVGASKAMGLKNSEIFAKYLLFGMGGALLGTAAGILIAYFVFERIVLFFFGSVFIFSEPVSAFQPIPVLLVTAGAALLSFTAVFLACSKLLKSSAVSLMSGQHAMGRARMGSSSGKGALYIRLMVRNMRTDWKRVCVSVVSIAGCCMLMMIGFSLKYAISRVPEKQYEEIQQYDMEITLDTSSHPESLAHARGILEEKQVPHACVYTSEVPYKAGEEPGMLTLICPDDADTFPDYYHLTDAQSGHALAVPSSGVLVSRMFAVQYQLESGDRFVLYDSRMNAHEVQIAGVFENYIGIKAICSKAYAEACLQEKLDSNTILLHLDENDPQPLRQRMQDIDGFISLASSRKQQALFDGISTMLNLVILLLGALAVMIACFILLNLVSTYVNQKKNELTIMRINGYTTGETIRYASMECYGITALGILLGLAAGQAFSAFLLRLIAQLSMCFVTDPVWISFLASAVITAAISGLIHYFAFRKIRGLKLSDLQR